MAITDFIHPATLDNVRAFNRNAGVANALEGTIQRATEPVRAAVASAALDAAKVDGLGSFARAATLTAARPALLDAQRAVHAQNWLGQFGESVNQLARVQRFSRGLTDSAIRGIAASVVDTRSQSLGFDLSTDRVNAALAASRPQTAALHRLIHEPFGPALSSVLRRSLSPSLEVPVGVNIGPRSTLATVFPNVDLDAVVDSARDGIPVIADSPVVEPVVVSAQTVPIEVERGGWTVGNTISLLSLLLAASEHEGLLWLSQQLIDYLIELSRSLSS